MSNRVLEKREAREEGLLDDERSDLATRSTSAESSATRRNHLGRRGVGDTHLVVNYSLPQLMKLLVHLDGKEDVGKVSLWESSILRRLVEITHIGQALPLR